MDIAKNNQKYYYCHQKRRESELSPVLESEESFEFNRRLGFNYTASLQLSLVMTMQINGYIITWMLHHVIIYSNKLNLVAG